MRVLWFSATPSLFEEKKSGGWIASLETAIRKYGKDIELGIAFEYSANAQKKKSGIVTYYPMTIKKGFIDKIKSKGNPNAKWIYLQEKSFKVIEDFKPDIIQVFGSEWPYGALTQEINIPLVVHMQGFLNVYNTSESLAYRIFDDLAYHKYGPNAILNGIMTKKKRRNQNDFEKMIMKSNYYFFGRTNWDEHIVKYYSPNAKYFYCPEALRPAIYDSAVRWQYNSSPKMKIITISQAGILKGNEMILRTAKLLKEDFGFDFEWRVAGNPEAFSRFEKKVGVRHQDVNIQLLGMIDAETIAKELSQAHIYVHPAIIDNSPNSLCEAQVIGCPVVSANVGGIPQLVTDGETGILYPYNEPHTLAFIIMDLYGDKHKLSYLSQNEQKTACKRHDPSLIVDHITKCYTEIIRDYTSHKE